MKSKKTKANNKEYAYYSPEIDEVFCLWQKPPKADKIYQLFVEDKRILHYVIYLGPL